jgi:hypothetical protein
VRVRGWLALWAWLVLRAQLMTLWAQLILGKRVTLAAGDAEAGRLMRQVREGSDVRVWGELRRRAPPAPRAPCPHSSKRVR